MTDVLLYIYVLVVLDNGQTWPKYLKISFLNMFRRDKKTVTNSFLEIIVRYVLENSLKSSKKKEDVATARVQRGEGIGEDGDILDLVVVMALLDLAHNACQELLPPMLSTQKWQRK